MGKILYPVGTAVQIRDWVIEQSFAYDDSQHVVTAYEKGAERPYYLDGMPHPFSVDEIKFYRPKTVATTQAPGITLEQVTTLIAKAFAERDEEELASALAADELLNQECFTPEVKKEENVESIRQVIRYATKSKQERVLTEAGILQNGALTEQGRRVVLDYLWDNDKDLQKAIYALVQKVNKVKRSKDEDDE